MKQLQKSLVVVLLVICCCLSNCNRTKESMQPYDGYQMYGSKEEIIKILKDKCVDTINFTKGDVIADIGAGNGSVEAMLSIFHDSLTFYIQDIDTSVCNQKTINEVISFYQVINKKPFTNNFIVVAGSDDKTNLPDDTFDKVLMLWTYQYFINPQAIMTDLKQKLKSDGLLYIVNPNVDFETSKELTSQYGWNASPIEKEISDIIEFGFELIRFSRNYEDPENPYIIIFKKKNP
ncbi:MAG: class I SAM-dependent methyltransferase [Bacteroidales bacterium]|nr:class I SAM-dependent methyltransferase [Bacteroidales bacterium]